MIKPFLDNDADVVYGSRLTGSKITKILGWPNLLGNKIFTLLANILYNRIFTDIATGYKIFKKEIIKEIDITSNGFEIEPEITAKICKNKKLIYLRFLYQFIQETMMKEKKLDGGISLSIFIHY